MKKSLLFSAIISINTIIYPAISHSNEVVYMGFGSIPCTGYLGLPQDDLVDSLLYDWALGYISGTNMYIMHQGGNFFDMKSIDYTDSYKKGFSKFMNEYCLNNPSSQLIGGVMQYMGTLQNTPSRK
jgi:hypothetical protein